MKAASMARAAYNRSLGFSAFGETAKPVICLDAYSAEFPLFLICDWVSRGLGWGTPASAEGFSSSLDSMCREGQLGLLQLRALLTVTASQQRVPG